VRALSILTFLATTTATVMAAVQDADALFHEGRKLAEAGDFTHACPKFAESERLDPAPGTLLNLAECEEHLGHIVEAQEHYRLAASGFAKKDTRRDFCTTKATSLEGHIAHMTLRLAPDAPPGTIVKKDNAVVAAADFGRAFATNPGMVTLVVSAPNHTDKTYPLTIKDGDTPDMTLQVGPVARGEVVVTHDESGTTSEKPKSSTSEKASPLRPVGIALGVVGVLGLDGHEARHHTNTETHCNTTTDICADQTGYSAAQDGLVLAPLSTTALIAGGVLAAAGAVFFILGGHSAKARVGLSLGGFNVSGTF